MYMSSLVNKNVYKYKLKYNMTDLLNDINCVKFKKQI